MSNLEILLLVYATCLTYSYWKHSDVWWKAGIKYGVKHYKALTSGKQGGSNG